MAFLKQDAHAHHSIWTSFADTYGGIYRHRLFSMPLFELPQSIKSGHEPHPVHACFKPIEYHGKPFQVIMWWHA